MNWFDVPQLFGYAGTACFLFNAALIALYQKTSPFYWAVTWLGNAAWLTAGVLMGQPAVVLDVLVFLPIHVLGCWRYWKNYDVPGRAWRNWTKEDAHEVPGGSADLDGLDLHAGQRHPGLH